MSPRYNRDRTRLLNENKARETTASSNHAQVLNFTTQNNQLKTQTQALEQNVSNLKFNIGIYITLLDLAESGFRVFTCRHKKFADIPDANHCTREQTAGLVGHEVFRDWKNDEEFMAEYNAARVFVLEHHRAHERVGQGRANAAWELKREMARVDEVRRVVVTYH